MISIKPYKSISQIFRKYYYENLMLCKNCDKPRGKHVYYDLCYRGVMDKRFEPTSLRKKDYIAVLAYLKLHGVKILGIPDE